MEDIGRFYNLKMKRFVVGIEEIVTQEFVVEAENASEAIHIAEIKYKNGDFILSPGELQSKRMAIIKPNEKTEWIEF